LVQPKTERDRSSESSAAPAIALGRIRHCQLGRRRSSRGGSYGIELTTNLDAAQIRSLLGSGMGTCSKTGGDPVLRQLDVIDTILNQIPSIGATDIGHDAMISSRRSFRETT
jgi:hypothetical protein